MKYLLIFLVALTPAAVRADFDRWFVLEMQGQRAGYAHMTMTTAGDVITTTNQMQISVRRGPMAIRIEQSQRFEETVAGEPLEAASMLKMGAMAMNYAYRFTPQGIEVTSEQGGQKQVRTLPPVQGQWFTPAAAQRHVQQQIEQGAESISLRTIDLSMGVKPVEATMTLLGEQNVEVFGKVVPAIAWDATVSIMPGMTMREYVDHEGRTLKTTMALGAGMEFTLLAADEQLARANVDPPEVLASMMITPTAGSAALDDPRMTRSAVYEVRLKPGTQMERFELPRVGYQRVVWGDQATARVVVDLDSPVNPGEDLPAEAHLAASMTLNHEDPKIRELLPLGLGGDGTGLTDADKAQRLRAFVHDYLTQKNLSVGFATASETARTREGDCTEHSVLLAALLRAAGIPSRTVTGLVYVDEFIGEHEVFGGHMWTQAWVAGDGQGGHWVDLDAVLPVQAFDAAHIALGVAAMDDDELVNELVKITPLLGSLEIKVIQAK